MDWLNGALLLLFFSGLGAMVWRVKSDMEHRIDRMQNGSDGETKEIWNAFHAEQSDQRNRLDALRSDVADLRTEVRVGFAGLKTFIKNGDEAK